MPPQYERDSEPTASKSLDEIIEEQGLYPIEAFCFVRRGLTYTVEKIHRELTDPNASRHVSGQQLCEGLREFALAQWGMLARAVLDCWNVRRTEDFGKIVFTLVDSGEMARTDEDTPDDFINVFDFAAAFDGGYVIDRKAILQGIESRA